MKRCTLTHLVRAAAVTLILGSAGPALALDELLLIAPAAPGGGWDQTARALQETMQGAGVAKTVTVDNIPGAGGTVGRSTPTPPRTPRSSRCARPPSQQAPGG